MIMYHSDRSVQAAGSPRDAVSCDSFTVYLVHVVRKLSYYRYLHPFDYLGSATTRVTWRQV